MMKVDTVVEVKKNHYEVIKSIILGRRSIRQFTEESVSIDDIKDLIDMARWAPSDTNSQTWEFIVIKNRDKIKHIENMTWEALHTKAKEAEEKGKEKEGKLLLKSFGPYATAFSDAPVLIICVATPYQSKFREKIFDPVQLVDDSVWKEEGMKSNSLACQNLMLAAHAKGLGTCPMTGPVLLAQEQLKKYLHIDENKEINMVIALGYPKVHPSALNRKGLDDILTIVE